MNLQIKKNTERILENMKDCGEISMKEKCLAFFILFN